MKCVKVNPGYNGRLTSSSYLVPTFPISVVEVQIKLAKPALVSEVCSKVRKLAQAGPQRKVVGYTEEDLVSGTDCRHRITDHSFFPLLKIKLQFYSEAAEEGQCSNFYLSSSSF